MTETKFGQRTFINGRQVRRLNTSTSQRHCFRAQARSLSLIIVGVSGEQWLDIALAMHTIEMIPKSMILIWSPFETRFYSFNSNLFLRLQIVSLFRNAYIEIKQNIELFFLILHAKNHIFNLHENTYLSDICIFNYQDKLTFSNKK